MNKYTIPQDLQDLIKQEFDLNEEIKRLANKYDPFKEDADPNDPNHDPLEIWKATELIAALQRKKSSISMKVKEAYNILLAEGKI